MLTCFYVLQVVNWDAVNKNFQLAKAGQVCLRLKMRCNEPDCHTDNARRNIDGHFSTSVKHGCIRQSAKTCVTGGWAPAICAPQPHVRPREVLCIVDVHVHAAKIAKR